MGARYGVSGHQATNTSTYKTILTLTGGTGVRIRLYDLMFGASGTPADNALVFKCQKTTAEGTNTTVTPDALESAEIAAETDAGENHSAEATYGGAEIIELPINQRASYRWVAAPGGEIISAATAGNGIGVASKSAAYTGQSEAVAHFEE